MNIVLAFQKDLISVDTFRDNKLFQNDFGDFDSV